MKHRLAQKATGREKRIEDEKAAALEQERIAAEKLAKEQELAAIEAKRLEDEKAAALEATLRQRWAAKPWLPQSTQCTSLSSGKPPCGKGSPSGTPTRVSPSLLH